MEEISDETYMLRIKQGNLSEMTAIFERYQVRMYNFFLKLSSDPNTSKDLTQQLFCKVLEHRGKYSSEKGSFKSWIYRIARNLYIDTAKLQKKLRDHSNELLESHNEIAVEETYRESDYSKLDHALLKLNPVQRELIILSRYQGMKYEEIAPVMNLTVAAARVRVHRAILELRKIYFTPSNENL